jgi:hypothetical protein
VKRKTRHTDQYQIRKNFLAEGRRTTAGATIAGGVLDVGNCGAVNTSSGRGASTTRGQLRARLNTLELAQHTGNRALFGTSRAEVEYNRLARPQSEMALGVVLFSAGEVTMVVLVLVAVGVVRRRRGRWSRWGCLGAAALATEG